MTATAAEGLPARALPGESDEQLHQEGPDGRTPEQTGDGAETPHRAGGRAVAGTVLFCLVIVQISWLAALTYGAYSLLR
ncbi:MAG TPA: hypothetical protein VFU51_05280 [Gaiellaceae bacterium]|nr:hypothetical protein [Gaiellaceae bacterium]